jgi:hypothetical protein
MLSNICSRYERMRCSRIKQHNCRGIIDEKHTNDHVRSFLGSLYDNMVDLPMNIVLLGSNRNRVGPMGRGRYSCSSLISTRAWIGASVSKMTLLSTSKTPLFSLQHSWSNLGPLNTLIPSSRSLEIVGELNHMMLRGRKSLSSYLRLSKMEHRSSCRCSNRWSRATA